jgi:NAD(P)-dependent dehydrogenase (short-subunit alcohol dehydrogenase family)
VRLFELTGRKAFVTGASRGIGRVIAVALAEAGADVALVARSEEGLAATAARVTGHGRKAFVIPADVTQQQAVADAAAAAIEQLGHVDIVVNNAGGSDFAVPFLDLRLPGWDKLLTLNLSSAVFVCHALGPHLVERGQGSVINVASVAGLVGSPFLAPYGAAKAGLIALTRTLAAEWAAHGVRVNALCPGWTATDLNRNLWGDETAAKSTVAAVPMRRWGRPEEMAGPAVFLASDASSYMTGQVLVIDGGQTALSGPAGVARPGSPGRAGKEWAG